MSITPPVSKDALIHHLAIPKLYLKHGGIYEIPTIVFSYYPMNLDLLYIIPLYFKNDIIPKFIHFSFAILTAGLTFVYIRHRINYIFALFGVALFLSIPIIIKLSISVYVDLGLLFFTTAPLLALLKWIEEDFSVKFLIISAICCGLAIGIKYNGLICFFLLTFFVPFIYSRYARDDDQKSLKVIINTITFFLIALCFFSPWMIKNYIWTNNPLFPLYDHLFNPQPLPENESLGIFTYRVLIYNEKWWDIALLPIRIFFQGQDGNPQYFDGKLNPFLLLLSIMAFYRLDKDSNILRREKKILLIFSSLYFLFALFSSGMRIRYILPIVPPMVILAVFGLKKMFDIIIGLDLSTKRKLGEMVVFFVILFSLTINIKYILNQFNYVRPFDYLKGTLTRDEYIEKYRPDYAAMKYINNDLSDDTRILFFFMGNRGYYCDRDYLFDMIQNKSMLRQFVIKSKNSEQVLHELRSVGITHLFIHDGLFIKWVRTNFEYRDQQLLVEFFKMHVKLLFSKHGYGVYRVGNI